MVWKIKILGKVFNWTTVATKRLVIGVRYKKEQSKSDKTKIWLHKGLSGKYPIILNISRTSWPTFDLTWQPIREDLTTNIQTLFSGSYT